MKTKERIIRAIFYGLIMVCIACFTSCTNLGVGGGAVYDPVSVFGGHAFIDYGFGQTGIGYTSGNNEAGDENASGIRITQAGKYPIPIGNIFLFPELGMEFNFAGQSESFLNNVLIRAGVGIDIPINDNFFIRSEGLYGLNVGRLLDEENSGYPHGLTVRLSLGYILKGRRGLVPSANTIQRTSQGQERNRYYEIYIPLINEFSISASSQIKSGVFYPVLWSTSQNRIFLPDFEIKDITDKSQTELERILTNANYLVLSPFRKSEGSERTQIIYPILERVRSNETADDIVILGIATFEKTRRNNTDEYVGIIEIEPDRRASFRRAINRIEAVR